MTEKDALPFAIGRDLMLNILSDAIEYSAGQHWAQVEEYRWRWWYMDDGDIPSPDLTEDTVLIRVRDDGDGLAEKEARPFVDITFRTLRPAILWALANHSDIMPFEVNNATVVDIDYDAIGADLVLQKIVFDEVLYG